MTEKQFDYCYKGTAVMGANALQEYSDRNRF